MRFNFHRQKLRRKSTWQKKRLLQKPIKNQNTRLENIIDALNVDVPVAIIASLDSVVFA